jgi:hypothetical protein
LDAVQSTLQFKPTLLNHKEKDVDDQNLDGFEFDSEESSKQKAVERQSMLENLANQLGDLFGEKTHSSNVGLSGTNMSGILLIISIHQIHPPVRPSIHTSITIRLSPIHQNQKHSQSIESW